MEPRSGQPGKPKYEVGIKTTNPEEEHIFYFSTTMALGLENVPTADLGSVDMEVMFNILLINPELAEFVAGKWEDRAAAAVESRAVGHIKSKPFKVLQAEKDTKAKDELVDEIGKANETQSSESGTKGLVPSYGIYIDGPTVKNFDVNEEGGAKELTAALRQQEIEKINLDTERTKAEQAKVRGDGRAKERQAEAAGIRTTVEAWTIDAAGPAIAMAEAIKEAQPSVIGGNVMAGINTEPRPRKERKDKPK